MLPLPNTAPTISRLSYREEERRAAVSGPASANTWNPGSVQPRSFRVVAINERLKTPIA
ncbi:hypothetical protein NG726_00415 [Pseudomonas sp. MOB-449]|nr:hypothetical protein [Pseudomonas sp. MOB-449]